MPVWTWDTEHYEGPHNKHMAGKFYVEDFENIKQLDHLVMEYRDRMARLQRQ